MHWTSFTFPYASKFASLHTHKKITLHWSYQAQFMLQCLLYLKKISLSQYIKIKKENNLNKWEREREREERHKNLLHSQHYSLHMKQWSYKYLNALKNQLPPPPPNHFTYIHNLSLHNIPSLRLEGVLWPHPFQDLHKW